MTSRATPEEITEVTERRRHCKEVWNLGEFVDALKELYELLVTMGHWPENCVDYPPTEGWSEADISSSKATRLGYNRAAIEVLTRLPYPADEPHYNEECDIFDSAQVADYRVSRDLKYGRYPHGSPFNTPSEVDGFIVPIMLNRNRDGTSSVLNVDGGTVVEWPNMDALRPNRVEYRVEQHLDGYDDLKDDFAAMADRLKPNYYRYLPFFPAAAYVRDLHQRLYTLRFLPLINPRYDADCEIDFSKFPERWRADYVRRRQQCLVGLYIEYHWPDAMKFNRGGVVAAWKAASVEFGEEQRQHFDEIIGDVSTQ